MLDRHVFGGNLPLVHEVAVAALREAAPEVGVVAVPVAALAGLGEPAARRPLLLDSTVYF